MYKAIFHTQPQSQAGYGIRLHVTLDATLIQSLTEMLHVLERHPDEHIDLVDHVKGEGGDFIAAYLQWNNKAGGFSLCVEGESVGVVLYDEMHASLSMDESFVESAQPCSVAFDMDGFTVWRKALHDLNSGEVVVYSKQDDFDFLPISVWIPVGGNAEEGGELCCELAPGKVQRGFLLTETQRRWLQESGGEIQASPFAQDFGDELESLFSDAHVFIQSDMRGMG